MNHYICNSLSSSLRYWQDDSGFESQQHQDGFLFSDTSRPVLGPIKPPIQWEKGALSLEVKRTGREADHLPPSSVDNKNNWSSTSIPLHAFMAYRGTPCSKLFPSSKAKLL